MLFLCLTQLTYAQPVITNFSPVTGPVGTVIIINGSGFSSSPASNIVYFGGTRAIVNSAVPGSLSVRVPPGAASAPITVTVNGLTAYSAISYVCTFTTSNIQINIYAIEKVMTVPIGVVTSPYTPVAADFDGDGKVDIVTGKGNATSLSLMRNTQTSLDTSFDITEFPTFGATTYDMVKADFDGDGKMDLASITASNILSIFRNISVPGTLDFTRTDYPTSGGRFGLAAGDIDGDGRPDVAVCNRDSNIISVFRNLSQTGSIDFATPVNLATEQQPQKLAIGDIDGDGKPEIAVANSSANSASVFRNTSALANISFAARVNYAAGILPIDIAIADIDNDSKPDMVVSNSMSKSFSVYRNTSNPSLSLAAPVAFDVSRTLQSLALGDINGDGKLEVIHGAWENVITISQNNSVPGTINFGFVRSYYHVTPSQGIAVNDLDGDGRPELTVGVNASGANLRIYYTAVGRPRRRIVCNPVTSTTLSAGSFGGTYQWQLDTGAGFSNISNNSNYSGTNSYSLQLSAIPSSFSNYVYRCLVDESPDPGWLMDFSNTWVGTISNSWENPANWSCNVVPDTYTNVVVHSGSIVISSNVTIRTLQINPAASVTVASNGVLTITN